MPPLPDPNSTVPIGPIKTRIDAINPEAGPISGKLILSYRLGETRVLVRGGPFSQSMELYYPKPMVSKI